MKIKGKILTVLLASLLVSIICRGQEGDTLLVMFWNMENFFDYIDGGEGESDRDFSSFGSRRWTKSRFQTKCDAVAKSFYWISDRYGRLPDIVGLSEIENSNVLYSLLNQTSLKKAGYNFIHFEGRDSRGIDVAFLYRKAVMKKEAMTRKIPVLHGEEAPAEGDTLRTRDILHVRMKTGQKSLDFIVNHHPSKYGGEKASMPGRMAAMCTLAKLCDSLLTDSPENSGGLVVMGDFNDTPDSAPFSLLDDILVNKGRELHAMGKGSIRYEGRWELIDMFMLTPDLAERSDMDIVRIPFLMVKDSRHTGEKPFRTYSGPKYIGGVSDHCPIILHIFL